MRKACSLTLLHLSPSDSFGHLQTILKWTILKRNKHRTSYINLLKSILESYQYVVCYVRAGLVEALVLDKFACPYEYYLTYREHFPSPTQQDIE